MLITTNDLSLESRVMVDGRCYVAFDKRTLHDGATEIYLVGIRGDWPLEVAKEDLDEPMWELA